MSVINISLSEKQAKTLLNVLKQLPVSRSHSNLGPIIKWLEEVLAPKPEV